VWNLCLCVAHQATANRLCALFLKELQLRTREESSSPWVTAQLMKLTSTMPHHMKLHRSCWWWFYWCDCHGRTGFQRKPIIIMCEGLEQFIIILDISTLQNNIGLIQPQLAATFPAHKVSHCTSMTTFCPAQVLTNWNMIYCDLTSIVRIICTEYLQWNLCAA